MQKVTETVTAPMAPHVFHQPHLPRDAELAKFYDTFRDTREELPVSTEIGAWGGAEFVRIIQRHVVNKKNYPDEPAARGVPYQGISNLRPETQAAVQAFLVKNKVLLEAAKQ